MGVRVKLLTKAARLQKPEREEVEREAVALYDRLNPEPDRIINVGKAKCIERVMRSRKIRKG